MKITFKTAQDFLDLFISWNNGEAQVVQMHFSENTCYALHNINQEILVVKKHQFEGEAIAEPLDCYFEITGDFFSIHDSIGNKHKPLEIEIVEEESLLEDDDNAFKIIISRIDNRDKTTSIPSYSLPIMMGFYEHSDMVFDDVYSHLYKDVAVIKAKNWNNLVDQVYAVADYQYGIIPILDFENRNDVQFNFTLKSLWYEGLTTKQAFSGVIPAELNGAALVNKVATQVPLNAIALTTVILGKENIKISDDGLYFKFATEQGAIVFRGKEPQHKIAAYKRSFKFDFSVDCKRKQLMYWIKPEGLVRVIMHQQGISLKQGTKLFDIINKDFSDQKLGEICSFQAYLLKDALTALQENKIRITLGQKATSDNDVVHIISLSCKDQHIMLLSAYETCQKIESDEDLLEFMCKNTEKQLSKNNNYSLKSKREIATGVLQNEMPSAFRVMLHMIQNALSCINMLADEGVNMDNTGGLLEDKRTIQFHQHNFDERFQKLKEIIKVEDQSTLAEASVGVFTLIGEINAIREEAEGDVQIVQATVF